LWYTGFPVNIGGRVQLFVHTRLQGIISRLNHLTVQWRSEGREVGGKLSWVLGLGWCHDLFNACIASSHTCTTFMFAIFICTLLLIFHSKHVHAPAASFISRIFAVLHDNSVHHFHLHTSSHLSFQACACSCCFFIS
jgi:hypothetical protein